jgi:hypothetical protein
MAILFTPLVDDQPNRAATFNAPLQEMEDSILARNGAFAQRTAWTTLAADATSISITVLAGDTGLTLYLKLRTDRAGNTDDSIRVRINNDVVSTYQTVSTYIGAATAFSITTGFQLDYGATGVTATSGLYAYSVVTLTRASDAAARAGRYDTVWQGTAGSTVRLLEGATWYPTAAAITSLQIVPVNGSNFVAGSQYALYGTP